MKKRSLLLVTLAISLLMTTTVFAKDITNYNCRNTSTSTRTGNSVYSSMMNGYNSGFGMSQEDFDAMNEFMEENFGYTMPEVANGSCTMTQEDFDAMNEFMKDSFGYSMMDLYGSRNTNSQLNSNSSTNNSTNSNRRSCH